jgi:hypothetical protein
MNEIKQLCTEWLILTGATLEIRENIMQYLDLAHKQGKIDGKIEVIEEIEITKN